MRSRAFATGLLLVCVGCGGSSNDKKGAITIEQVAASTSRAGSVRISGTTKPHGQPDQSWSGEAEFPSGRFHMRMTDQTSADFIEFIAVDNRLFVHGNAFSLHYENWCEETEFTNDLAFDPTAVLRSLGTANGTLQRVGTDDINGVHTTHYSFRTTKPDEVLNDVWVDKNDRLSRLVQVNGAGTDEDETDTADFYDYGASFPPITAPAGANACGGATSSGSATPGSTAP